MSSDHETQRAIWSTSEAADLRPASPVEWFPAVYRTFAERVLTRAEDYPCHFGVQGQQRGNNWFGALDRRAPDRYGVTALAGMLRDFQRRAWTGPVRQSLIVFAGPPEPGADLADHHRRFWRLLADLSAADPDPWPPPGEPADPAHPAWQWHYAGEPWFVFAASPGYRRRRSRDLGPCLTMVFQTSRVFQGISGSSPAGRAAKSLVRKRLSRYDTVPVHPHLGDPLHSSVHKWRQYALPDDGSVLDPTGCPISGSHPTGPRPEEAPCTPQTSGPDTSSS